MPQRASSRKGTIVDEETFTFLTELELRKAVRLHYGVSILAILAEPHGEGEIPDPRRVAEPLARVISLAIRDTDAICLPASSSALEVLLVAAPLEHLAVIIQRIADEVSRHLFEINGERKPVTLSAGGACFPTTAGTRQELLTQAEGLLREARQGRPGRPRYRLPGSPNVGQGQRAGPL